MNNTTQSSNFMNSNMPKSATAFSGSVNAASKPPAQRPSEFAAAICEQTDKLNNNLRNLRYRLFGESEPESGSKNSELAPPTPSLECLIQSAHYSLTEAINQLESIQNRL